jgi:hypothetical protein
LAGTAIVEGAPDAVGAAVEDVGVDHGRADVVVAEQLLDGADVVAVLKEVGCKAVAKGVGVTGFDTPAVWAAARTVRWTTVSWMWWRRTSPVAASV